MSLTVDYSTTPWLITVPKSDLTLDTGTQYILTVDTFWFLLRDYADSPESLPNPIIYTRIPATASTPSITEINLDYYRIQFEDGLYSVNIINGNTNIREGEIKNQVSVNTNNTTGFIDPTFLEAGLFAGVVCVDIINGVAGTDKTAAGGIIGTRQTPVNNMDDAHIIAQTRGIRTFDILASMTIETVDLSDGHQFIGDSPFINLTVESSANVSNCDFTNLTITGYLDGINVVRDCLVNTVFDVSGIFEKCAFTQTVTLLADTYFFECYSAVTGSGYPTANCGANNLTVRNFRGSLGLENLLTGHISSVGVYGGRCILENTCVDGDVHLRGDPFELVDNSLGTTVLIETTVKANWADINALTVPKYLGLK